MLKSLPLREKLAKILLILLVIIACITIFPKNFKIVVLNYDGRQSAVVLGDAKTGVTKEASYIFGKGNFWVTPIIKGTVKSLYIEDEKEFVDDVTAYYGSVKISKDFKLSGEEGNLTAELTYSVGKIVLMITLYALLSLSLMVLGILKIIKSSVSFPEKIKTNIDWIDILIFGGISATYMVVSYIVSMNQLIRWIYPLEIAFSGLMLFVTLCVEKQLSNYRIGTTISALPIGTCLAISINKICAFTFVDGHQAIMEQVNYATDRLRHWEKNSARLNYIIMGTFERFNFIEKLKGETPAKIIHWLFGVILFVYIVWFITKKLLRNDSDRLKVFQFTTVFCSIFLYNYTLTALKNYNYDLFSVTFGSIAFIHMIYAARTHSRNYAISALVFATLGTLEKIIVWPIMLLCMLAYVIIATLGKEKPYLKAGIYTLKAECIALTVSACCNLWIQHVVRGDYFPNYRVINLVKPLQGQMYSVLGGFAKSFGLKNDVTYIICSVVQVFMIWIGFVIVYALHQWISGHKKIYDFGFKVFVIFNLAIFLSVIMLGIWGQDLSVLPIAAIETSVSTFGTAFLGLILIMQVLYIKEVEHKELFFFLISFGSIVPALYTIIDATTTGRYFNLFNLLIIIIIDCVLLDLLSEKWICQAVIVGIAGVIISIVEVIPFGPDHFYYKPVWNNSYSNRNYFAGGIERLKIGEEIQKYYSENNLDGDNVVLYFNYGGDWNACPSEWECKTFLSDGLDSLGDYTFDDIEFGENVYYIFTMADRYPFYPMPDAEYKPILSPMVRGKLIGNVYRSEDLRPYFENVFATNK